MLAYLDALGNFWCILPICWFYQHQDCLGSSKFADATVTKAKGLLCQYYGAQRYGWHPCLKKPQGQRLGLGILALSYLAFSLILLPFPPFWSHLRRKVQYFELCPLCSPPFANQLQVLAVACWTSQKFHRNCRVPTRHSHLPISERSNSDQEGPLHFWFTPLHVTFFILPFAHNAFELSFHKFIGSTLGL